VVMVHALFGHLPSDCVRVDEHQTDSGSGWIVQCHRPELGLALRLSEGEMAVLSGRIQGQAYAEIASERGTSARTVANQIANIHRKLGISGRLELLCYLASQLQPWARTIAA